MITDAPIVALCALVLRELPDRALAGLSLTGAAFVAWLAWDALRAEGSGDAAAAGARADLRRAALVNALSPHPWLFWLTVGGPLLVDAGHRSALLAAAFLGGFYATLVGAKVAIAGVATLASKRVASARGTRVVSALLLGAVAVALLADAIERLDG